MARMSGMVRPCHWSIQQKTSRWNFENRRGYCCNHPFELRIRCHEYLVSKALDHVLQTEPLEVDRDELVRAHHRLDSLTPVALQLTATSFLNRALSFKISEQREYLRHEQRRCRFRLDVLKHPSEQMSLLLRSDGRLKLKGIPSGRGTPCHWQCRFVLPRVSTEHLAATHAAKHLQMAHDDPFAYIHSPTALCRSSE